MPKFRKKPVVIEAIQWIGKDSYEAVKAFAGESFICWHMSWDTLSLKTPEGTITASLSDWIIKGVKGEIYPCKPDIFAWTYEPVEDEEPTLDWPRAKAHLDHMQEEYENLAGGVSRFALAITIMPLQDRYARGERTKWLYDEIMEVE